METNILHKPAATPALTESTESTLPCDDTCADPSFRSKHFMTLYNLTRG